MQQIAEVFFEVVDGVHDELDPEVCGVGVGYGDLQCGFAASGEFTQEGFAIEEPRVRKVADIWAFLTVRSRRWSRRSLAESVECRKGSRQRI